MARRNFKRKFSAKEKFDLVKTVITNSRTVSEICDEYKLHPNQYYRWQKEFFEGAFNRFTEGKVGRKGKREQREREESEKERIRLNEVIAEVVKENIALKKKNF